MAWTKEARRAYDAKRTTRASRVGKEIALALSGAGATLSAPAREGLARLLHAHRLTPSSVIREIKIALRAKRPWGSTEHPLWVADNDARARARDQAKEWFQMSGELPTADHDASRSGFHLHIHLDGLEPPQDVVDVPSSTDAR